jgi:hypothetical protein
VVFAKPWGFPLPPYPQSVTAPKADDGRSTGFSFDLLVDQQLCNSLGYVATDQNTYPWVFLNYYPKLCAPGKGSTAETPCEQKLEGAIRAAKITFADNPETQPPRKEWCAISFMVKWTHLIAYPFKQGPVVMRLVRGGTGEAGMQAASVGTVATGSDFDTSGYEVGRSVGKMYFFEPPGALAQLQPSLVYNGPACQSEILIALPPHVMVMEYFVSSCQWRDETAKELPNGDFAWSPPVAKRLELDTHPRRGIRCTVPPKTGRYVTLQVTLNGQQWHTVTQRLERVGKPKLEEGDVPGTGTVRVYRLSI